MRLGLIIYGPLDTRSGGFLYDRKLVDYLRRQGDEVEIISLPWSGYGRHLSHNLSPVLFNRLRRADFDILLQDELNHPSLFWLNGRLKRMKDGGGWQKTAFVFPIVAIVHHLRISESRPAWQNRLYRLVERAYLQRVAGFICNSRTTLAEVTKLAGERPSIIAMPAGDRFNPDLNDEFIIARAHEPGPLRIIFVGNLIPRKGLPLLLDVLAALPPNVCRLDVVGDTAVNPAHTRAIRRQIECQQLQNRVILHGRLSTDELAQRLAKSHVLAVPSRYEGFGIVYLEGMGFGLPAIAGSGGAAHEIITNDENGFLCQLSDVNCESLIADFLRALNQNRSQLARMSLAARHRFQAHPTWDESMARIRHFLLSLTIRN